MSYMKMGVRNSFIDAAYEVMGMSVKVLDRKQIQHVCNMKDLTFPAWFTSPKYRTITRGVYDFEKMVLETQQMAVIGGTKKKTELPETPQLVSSQVPGYTDDRTPIEQPKPEPKKEIQEITSVVNYIPEINKTFVPFGYHDKMEQIITSGVFMPVFIAGLSGNGKTLTTEQICAKHKREFINVPVTIETNEDDLLGGFRLIDGETRWSNGPVIEAMERGAVLLIDEIDLASHKIMCLQSIIDGKGVYLKKINKYVRHEPGFTIVVTANTKGKGKWQGQFVGTNILNESFLERFVVLFEQEYPLETVEKKILRANLKQCGIKTSDDEVKKFVLLLVQWANQIRKQFNEMNISEVISTRRLVHIVRYYSVFKDRLDAVKQGTNRFSDDNKESFIQLFAAMDGDESLIQQLHEQDAAEPVELVSVSV